ncbi:hypothetical protein ACVWZD_005652 [Streptomyces sp. TE3672]
MGSVPFALGLDAVYCRPGLEGAHEKAGVEGEVGRFRRNHFVPVPVRSDWSATRSGCSCTPQKWSS